MQLLTCNVNEKGLHLHKYKNKYNIKIDLNVNINMEMSVLISQSKDIFRDFASLRIHIVYTLLQPVNWFG